MLRFHQPKKYTEEMLRIGEVYFCLREMNPGDTHNYEMCITNACDGEYTPVYLNDRYPMYQGVFAFSDKDAYDMILTAMRNDELELVKTLQTLGNKFNLWADALKLSLPNAEHKSYRAFVA